MASPEMFVDETRSAGDLAGVFEYDGETGYFYLYDRSRPSDGKGSRILGFIHIVSRTPDFAEEDVVVRWSKDEITVGLFIRGKLWAAFSGGGKFGGDFRNPGVPNIPEWVSSAFAGSG